LDGAELSIPANVAGAKTAANAFLQDISEAIVAMEARAGRLARGDVGEVLGDDRQRLAAAIGLGAAGAAMVASIRARVRDKLQGSLLRILGQNGRIYRYGLSYYVGLAASMAKGSMQKELALHRASELSLDLVQVSPNPSTIGDYCDLYRGKVFSISGMHPIFPALSTAPNGGTPFHPWCKHTLAPFDASGLSDAKIRELANIPEDFMQLGMAGASANDFQKLWKSRKKGLGF